MNLNFSKNNGLIPTIIQDFKSLEVLMLGFMNKEAFKKTLNSGLVYFWSRTRKKLWIKGEKSGNKLKVKEFFIDCDQDTLLIKVELIGTSVCHSGNLSCFYTELERKL